ncbi:histidine--tRNA ligase [soil metagenome]
MTVKIQAIRGMNDILPDSMPIWHFIEQKIQDLMQMYGYQEVRFPILEKTELFKRTIGEVTDIVEKEMYTFLDRNEDSLTMRPEGTAGCARVVLENGLLHNQIQKLWYLGPMFRYERPQKGRYRQFHQFGVEAFNLAGPDIDAELILLSARLWHSLGLHDSMVLQLNCLGSTADRLVYRERIVEYFNKHSDQLDEDSQRRLTSNPLRILDSKNPAMQQLLNDAPSMLDYLGAEAQQHFQGLRAILDAAKVRYVLNPRLVRGLDYYSNTVFEWVTTELGAQGTVCAGGRYDGLVAQLGGDITPAVGFALGLERLVELVASKQTSDAFRHYPDIYLIMLGIEAERTGLIMAERLRDTISKLQLLANCGGGSFKAQLKRADKSGARLAIILGENELTEKVVIIKFLREEREQKTLSWDVLEQYLQTVLMNK